MTLAVPPVKLEFSSIVLLPKTGTLVYYSIDVDHGGKQVGSATAGNGVDVIAYAASRKHLYVPGASSATMTILDVKATGELATLATLPTAKGAHCVAADDQGGVWVCDPEKGRLLYFKDALGASH